MNFWKEYMALRSRACDLKERGDFHAVPLIRQQVVDLLVAHQADPQRIVSAWNSLAGAHRDAGDFAAAERAAKCSLSLYVEHFTERDERLATYLATLAATLQSQHRFTEAVPCLEEALAIFETCRGAEDNWVIEMRADLAEWRQQTWRG